MKAKIQKYDGHLSTRFEVGSDGTCAMHLRDTHMPRVAPRLTGWGHDERDSARHLVEQLRLYADWIAHEHGLTVVDADKLRAQVESRTGKPMESKQ